jgi:hypothetical protein
MSIQMVTKGGKLIGEISDDCQEGDTLLIRGKKANLEDVYNSEKLTEDFNTQAKELKDVSTQG